MQTHTAVTRRRVTEIQQWQKPALAEFGFDLSEIADEVLRRAENEARMTYTLYEGDPEIKQAAADRSYVLALKRAKTS